MISKPITTLFLNIPTGYSITFSNDILPLDLVMEISRMADDGDMIRDKTIQWAEQKNTIPVLLKKLELVFNRYIRLRDTDWRGYGSCISCSRTKHFRDLDAGHFFTVRNSAVRFDERNVWAQCAGCNRFQADYYKPYYAANLVRKIGLEAFQDLERLSQETFKWDRAWLLAKITEYQDKTRSFAKE